MELSDTAYLSSTYLSEPWFNIKIFMDKNGITDKRKKIQDLSKAFKTDKELRKSEQKRITIWGKKSNAKGYSIQGARGGVRLIH